ncbi:hypothetical protein OCGS_2404 [Oceaniovalibus guishaninsula JLT2003]|uniref:Glycosyl transferase family 2 n=1 Tax=Oceaniovalibus guishaninsula JLT2003 TaxID=1231392 RepID=K2HAK7_9RHOB|nr:glycosyltransferase family 2 protein [Oceaniovalibus guishaninsula]EKE43672.1 hypothetical protein OCGS_2404 [Oceaniovalibus guishaninsula JLT2003]
MTRDAILRAAEAEVSVARNAPLPRPGLPMVTLVRNEMALLPPFLAHYRDLGIGHFFILDDASDDGTAAYLGAQDDVSLIVSPHRYGDPVTQADYPYAGPVRPGMRRNNLWKSLLLARFVGEGWAAQCDADEFIHLPPGTDLADVADRLDAQGANAVWAAMIDLYPRQARDVLGGGAADPAYFFDGTRHVTLSGRRVPRHRYESARHRLAVTAGVARPLPFHRRMQLRLVGRSQGPSGTLVKQPLVRWHPQARHLTAHVTTLDRPSRSVLLPLAHYYYHHGTGAKLDGILASGGYNKGNAAYRRLAAVLTALDGRGIPLTCPLSRPLDGYAGFAATGNAAGL